MILPQVVRVFFAVDLNRSVKEQIASLITTMKKQAKSNAIRWCKPDNLHVTLQFLAEIPQEALPTLISNVRAQLNYPMEAIQINFLKPSLFPNPFRPRVIALELQSHTQLGFLAQQIGKGILATHFDTEDRPFRGHLSLGRIKYINGDNLSFLSHIELPAIDPIFVEEVVLFRSEPHPDGSHYTPLERIKLNLTASKAKMG